MSNKSSFFSIFGLLFKYFKTLKDKSKIENSLTGSNIRISNEYIDASIRAPLVDTYRRGVVPGGDKPKTKISKDSNENG